MKKKHVLLIDDNDIDNYISNHIVTNSKMAEKVSVKTSAADALEYLETLKGDADEFPDFIFLDIQMPKMDGFGFLEEFIKFPEAINKQCFVAMLTSSSHQDDIERALQYSVVKTYLNKPLSLEKLECLST